MLAPEAGGERGGDSEVAAAKTSSARTGRGWWRWWWAPCAVRSTMICCGKQKRQGMCGSEADADDGSKQRSDRCDRKSCSMRRRRSHVFCTRSLPDHASAHKNPLHSTAADTKLVALTDVLVDEQTQKLAVKHDDSESSDYLLTTSSRALPSARCGGCPVAGTPIPPGHRCSWCHTCPHPGPTVYLELASGD